MNRMIVAAFCVAFVSVEAVHAQADKKQLSFTSEWLPLKVGNRWNYQGVDPKEKIIVTVERSVPFKREIPLPNGGVKTDTLESFVLRINSGDRTAQHEQWLIGEDGIYRVAAGGKEIKPPLKILKLPPASGDAWPCDSSSEATPLKGDMIVEQTVMPGFDGPVLLAKTRDFTVGDQKLEAAYWFARNVGIIKQQVKIGNFGEMSTTLDLAASSISAPPSGKSAVPELPKVKLDFK
jgi:hypothetical protein